MSKIVKKRDAATAALRKLGVKKTDYNQFISKLEDGTFKVEVTKAKAHLAAAKKPAKDKKPRKVSCSAVARELIQAGKSNAEVWAIIKEQFKLDDAKRHYPTWYRCQLKRLGKKS